MKASFENSEAVKNELTEQLKEEASKRGYEVNVKYTPCATKKIAEYIAPVSQVRIELVSWYDRKQDEVWFAFSADYYEYRIPTTEREKVNEKRFETAKEAMDFIEERAKRINDFFESLD